MSVSIRGHSKILYFVGYYGHGRVGDVGERHLSLLVESVVVHVSSLLLFVIKLIDICPRLEWVGTPPRDNAVVSRGNAPSEKDS